MNKRKHFFVAVAVGLSSTAGAARSAPMGTAFTFQGYLERPAGTPVTDTCGFRFGLWDAADFGVQKGSSPQTKAGVVVSDGVFTVSSLDFGAGAIDGNARWLEIEVQCPGDDDFVKLEPRVELTPAPHALALPGLYTQQNATSPNIIGGHSGNGVTAGAMGATISGGGSVSFFNRVTDDFGTVGGGGDNQAGDGAGTTTERTYATVSGGFTNTASGDYSIVGGGDHNTASAYGDTVGGGYLNVASGGRSTVGGGSDNTARGDYSIIAGGASNDASGSMSIVGGGNSNDASALVSTVAGGADNTASGDFSIVGGGYGNTAGVQGSTVGGGQNNTASGLWSTVGGGYQNTATAENATVGGGWTNAATAGNSTIAGGYGNTGGGVDSTIGGGYGNTASELLSTIGGGYSNTASGSFSIVGGGQVNTASGGSSTVGGGQNNTASGWHATVPGGLANHSGGEYSFAAGYRAKVRTPAQVGDADGDQGTFVWADSTDADFTSTGPDQFLIRATGGMWFGTTSAPTIPAGTFLNTSTGGYLTTGGVWTDSSDREKKENFESVDRTDLLERVARLPITRWNFKDGDPLVEHLGPVAQDFHAEFGLGDDDKHIAALDTAGVALAAIQGLYQMVQDKDCEITELRDRETAKEQRINELETRLAAIEALLGRSSNSTKEGAR